MPGLPPIQRPEGTRPRSDAPARPEAEPDPPSASELEAVESQLVELAGLAGASVEWDHDLEAALVRWPGRGPALNHVEHVRWPSDSAGLEDRLRLLATRLRDAGDRPAVLVAAGLTQPPDLAARLAALGWRRTLHERILWTRRAAVVPHLDPLMRIEAVTPASVQAYEALERAIFELDGTLAEARSLALERAVDAGRLRAYIVRVVDEPIATARLWSFGSAACLDGVGVVERARRRGYGSLIATIATRAALAMGHRLVWLEVAEANEPARRMYERLDYRPAFDWELWVGG